MRVGDMHALPWDDARFDVVTSFRGIWGTTPEALDEVLRVLAPGGRVGLTVWGHIKVSPGAWALAPFRLAAEPKVANQAAMVALGTARRRGAAARGRRFRRRRAGRHAVRLGVRRPGEPTRARWPRPGPPTRRSRPSARRRSGTPRSAARSGSARGAPAARRDRRDRLPRSEATDVKRGIPRPVVSSLTTAVQAAADRRRGPTAHRLVNAGSISPIRRAVATAREREGSCSLRSTADTEGERLGHGPRRGTVLARAAQPPEQLPDVPRAAALDREVPHRVDPAADVVEVAAGPGRLGHPGRADQHPLALARGLGHLPGLRGGRRVGAGAGARACPAPRAR